MEKSAASQQITDMVKEHHQSRPTSTSFNRPTILGSSHERIRANPCHFYCIVVLPVHLRFYVISFFAATVEGSTSEFEALGAIIAAPTTEATVTGPLTVRRL
jgi:hypothetical protein